MASSSYSPPPHFSILHPLLYRSASPLPPSFPYLHSLHLETVISLGPDPPTRALLTFCTNEGVRLLDLGGREREEGIKEGLEFLLERENEPCLVVDQCVPSLPPCEPPLMGGPGQGYTRRAS